METDLSSFGQGGVKAVQTLSLYQKVQLLENSLEI